MHPPTVARTATMSRRIGKPSFPRPILLKAIFLLRRHRGSIMSCFILQNTKSPKSLRLVSRTISIMSHCHLRLISLVRMSPYQSRIL